MTDWLNKSEYDEDVIISSRIRVARNLSDYKFPAFMTTDESDKLTDDILNTMKDSLGENYRFIRTRDLNTRQQLVYVENHLISPNMIEAMDRSSFLLKDNNRTTILINEEDHIRIQTLAPGLNLMDAWETCSSIDDKLEKKLGYAYDEKWGYLTSCPTNVGTGLRASVMLHLPRITMTRNINTVIEGLRKMGLTARGLYGEGSEALGQLYQISNQTTLGESEEEVINKLSKVINQIITRERGTRNHLKENRLTELEDKVFRSYGILQNSRILSSKEAMEHLSNVRLGWIMGMIYNDKLRDTLKLMLDIQPAKIQEKFGEDMSSRKRDIERAKLIRDYIKDME